MKKILVLDYPSEFLFPPNGYGGIERWLWSIAKQSTSLGHKVILSGPLWQTKYLPSSTHFNKRINENTYKEFLNIYGKVDYLIGGHEYWNDDKLREIFSFISNKSMTFQLMPDLIYKKRVFDNKKHFLFCFSKEMQKRFYLQNPSLLLCSAEGINEDPLKFSGEDYLVWLGRLDEEKAPHLAIMAAQTLNMKIKIIGKPQYDKGYYNKYMSYFKNPLVTEMGMLSGYKKMEAIAKASAAIYTCSYSWVEAAGMIFSEYLRSGIPVVALAWRRGTAAESTIDKNTGGLIIGKKGETDEDIALKLSVGIKECLKLNREKVYVTGNNRFSPNYLTSELFRTVDNFH